MTVEAQVADWEADAGTEAEAAIEGMFPLDFKFPDNVAERFLVEAGLNSLKPGLRFPSCLSRVALTCIKEQFGPEFSSGASGSYLRQSLRGFMDEVMDLPAVNLKNMLPQNFWLEYVRPNLRALQRDIKKDVLLLRERAAAKNKIDELLEDLNAVGDERDHFRRRFEEAQADSLTDSLTTLPNRRAMEERMRKIAQEQPAAPFVFMVFDLDKFKDLNDEFGHLAGDKALYQLGGFISDLSSTLRYDDICRWGGDEFGVLIPNGDGRAEEVAELIRNKVAESTFILPTNSGTRTEIKKTLSIGLAHCTGADLATDAPYRKADAALHLAKGHRLDAEDRVLERNVLPGRDRVVVYGKPSTYPQAEV
ncbi:MAG: GGDEF domain-containing protein [Candidatus Gracilibacteria bacterium]|jgi:diguanylate cyclase (GGDEF)-like protein